MKQKTGNNPPVHCVAIWGILSRISRASENNHFKYNMKSNINRFMQILIFFIDIMIMTMIYNDTADLKKIEKISPSNANV